MSVSITETSAKVLDQDATSAGSPTPSEASVKRRGPIGQALGVRVLGTGSYVPTKVVTNEDLAALGCDSDWIVRRTGIKQRRKAAADEATSDLAYHAAMAAMQQAGVTAAEIDLILVATMTPDYPTPSAACELQRRLAAVAPAMDLNAACAGFMYAAVTAAQFIRSGNSRCVLVVGADVMTGTINPEDKKTYPLFGDGAGAVIMGPDAAAGEGSGSGILAYQLGSEGCGGEMLCIPSGGSRSPLTPQAHAAGQHYLRMDGRNVFKWAVRVFEESTRQVLAHAGLSAQQVDLIILHQANQRIIDSAVSDLHVPAERVFVNLDRYGNTSAASIPLALDEAVRGRGIQPGSHVLLCGFGSGLAWGTTLWRW